MVSKKHKKLLLFDILKATEEKAGSRSGTQWYGSGRIRIRTKCHESGTLVSADERQVAEVEGES
jgi:hypothetical protein